MFFEIFVCLNLLFKIANIGADLITRCHRCQCTHRQRVDGCLHQEEKLSKTQLEKCTHCGQLILRKMSKIGAIRWLKYTKFDFRWGSAPDPADRTYSAPPDPLAVFKGAYF